MGAAIVAAVWLSAAADAGTTHYAIRHGLTEANPIVRSFGVQEHPGRVWLVKAAGAGLVLGMSRKMPKKQQRIYRASVAALWFAVSAWNYTQAKQHGR